MDNPYKLCDYRPAFGYIFKDLTRGFDYWGYCDLDMIFGDLQKYLPTKKYDKISRLGPFCLYRNIKRVNEAFMLNGNCKFNYKGIFSSNVHFAFDEIGKYGINSIFDKYGYSIYDYQNNAADLNCILEGMNITSGHSGNYTTSIGKRVFEFNKGKIYGYLLNDTSILKNEYAYIHFQKRKMILNVSNSKKNCIITHHLITNKNDQIIDIDFINNNQPRRKMIFRKWIKLKIRAVKVRLKRLFVIVNNS